MSCHAGSISSGKMQGASEAVVDQSSSHFPQPPSWSTWHPECVPSASVWVQGVVAKPPMAAPALYPTRKREGT